MRKRVLISFLVIPMSKVNVQGTYIVFDWRQIMTGIIIAIVSGILMSIQGVFNTEVTKQSSLWTTSAFVQLTALIVCIIAWLLTDRSNPLLVLRAKPAYFLLGGAIGAFITYTVVVSMSQLGPAKAVMIIVTAQIISAYLIEVIGLFRVQQRSISINEICGIIVTIVGIIIFKMKG